MANIVKNHLRVIGLRENPEKLAKALELEMYGTVVPHEPGNPFVKAGNGGFDFTTEWQPDINALFELSKKYEDHTFLLSYACSDTDYPRNGKIVISNRYVEESVVRKGFSGLFDEIEYPTLDLFRPYLQSPTLAESAASCLQDAIEIVRGLIRTMDDERFTDSPSTPYSDARDQEKTKKARAGLGALLDSMVTQVRQLDFEGVLLEEAELREKMARNAQVTKNLMKSLGLDHLVPGEQSAVRFAILPFTAAIIQDPHRVVLPVIHYANADPVSGDYQKNANGSTPPIVWKIRYVCLRPWQVRRINSLLVGNQTPCDLDLEMTNAGGAFGNALSHFSKRPQWTLNSELVKQVEQEAIQMSHAFAAKLGNTPGITIFDDFKSAEAALSSGGV